MLFVESCFVMLEDIMSFIQTVAWDAIDTIASLMKSQLYTDLVSLFGRLSACLASLLKLILCVQRNAAYLKDYLNEGVIDCSHAAPSTQVQTEETGKDDRVKEPTVFCNTNEEYSERSTEDIVGAAIVSPSLKKSRSFETEARSAYKSPEIKMGTRSLRQSPTDVDFFDIDSNIYNTMRRQRLTSTPKIKHGITALRCVAYEAPIIDIHDSNTWSESTPREIVDINNTASITETTPRGIEESNHEINRLNTEQRSPKKKSLAKRIRKLLTPKMLIAFGRNFKNPYITLGNRYCAIFS
ncbi:unnamed protein product [Owenia fusiformis]|uniref:Uncharacterized protein n=1 Tax=Owenia fusiformis TaxID=6347 RepID=A0A8S4NXR6_OWEFU|nr:unnamed protein product [Owenia fusiformis]